MANVPKITPVLNTYKANESQYDGFVVLYTNLKSLIKHQNPLLTSCANTLSEHLSLNKNLESGIAYIVTKDVPGSRLILSPTHSLNGDVDDVRRYSESARAALAKCISIGIKKPLFYISAPENDSPRLQKEYSKRLEVSLLGLLAESYTSLQAREHLESLGTFSYKIDEIGVYCADQDLSSFNETLKIVNAIEQGRVLARDIGGSDPERMTPLKCAHYILDAFKDHKNIKVSIVSDPQTIEKEYPLLYAVARCSLSVSRHYPVTVRLEYHSPAPSSVKENIFLVGKGVTYDTGGADIKYGGAMRGMSRDKCGAAACGGFLKTVSLLQPHHVNVIADLGFVRNSSGSNNYVSDEIIKSRAGVRVLIGNTDAEGRMVMGDLLCEAKERALKEPFNSVPSRILTVATLTGHAIRAMGVGYSISLDNGPAREGQVSKRLFDAGHLIGDPFETSTLRREDYNLIKPSSENEDVVQANDKPSTMTSRGHQYPAAFLSLASGLSKHGLDSQNQISFTHVDIAGSAEESSSGLSLPRVTGSPIAAFTAAFLTSS